jgi:FkbM family methyltransferase
VRKLIDFFVSLYLLPLRTSSKLALYIKGKILTHDEHYIVALDTIRRRFPNDPGIVVDIGAFDADSTVYLARRLTRNRILGFEPNPIPYQNGIERANPFPNVQLFNIGFSDAIGTVDLHLTKNMVSSSLYDIKDFSEISPDKVIKVNVDTLDNFFADYKEILLLKLDVQGAELKILKAGKETLKKTKLLLTEVLVTEIYHGACQYHDVDQFLRSNDFQIHTIITNYNKDGVKYFDILYINSIYL